MTESRSTSERPAGDTGASPDEESSRSAVVEAGSSRGGGSSRDAVSSRDADSRDGRPLFARDFPRDEELDELVAAFAAGNYAIVRQRAPELARRAADPKVAAAAGELARRLSPDPLALYLMALTAALLAALSVWAWLHGAR